MSKRIQEISDFQATNLTAQAATAITTELDQSAQGTGPLLIVALIPAANTITNTNIDLSVGIKDETGVEVWSPKQTVTVRTLPDGTKIVPFAVFNVYRSQHIRIALETAITGTTVAVKWATAVTV